MIERFHVRGYKALRDVTLDLTPMHVLIGPNDSGKSSILEALGAFCRSAEMQPSQSFLGAWKGHELLAEPAATGRVMFDCTGTIEGTPFSRELGIDFAPSGTDASVTYERIMHGDRRLPTRLDPIRESELAIEIASDHWLAPVRRALVGIRQVVWLPEVLALPVAMGARGRYGIGDDGFGLATLLDDLLGADRRQFDHVERRFCRAFSYIEGIELRTEDGFPASFIRSGLRPATSVGKALYFRCRGADHAVPAAQMSSGVLIFLAYLALLHVPEPPRVLLVEEPENGIHPARLKEILTLLRELIAEHPETQVLMTTHSPYVLDCFSPEEVTLCTRGDDGAVRVRRFSEMEQVRRQTSVFTLGEIWTAEGDETLAGTPTAPQPAQVSEEP